MRHTIQLTPEQLSCIHDKTVKILEIAGVDLRHKGTSELMKKKGFKVDGTRLYITEKQLMETVDSTPDRFILKSVTSDKQVRIGGNDFIIIATSGASSVVDDQGRQRDATYSDYIDFLKLNHTSDVLNVMSPLIVQPTDIPTDTIHVDLMVNALTITDKPCLATAINPKGALESLKILSFCCGSRKKLESDFRTVFNINALSPLGYAPDEIESLMHIAQAKQPMTITNSGSSDG